MISYIIVTYKSEMLIEECIRSILKFNHDSEFEIIVVDNSPSEHKFLTEDICSKFNHKIIYMSNENLGYGQGNNIGIKKSKGDIICIVNPDVRFVEPYVNIVNDYFSCNKNNALISFKQIGGSDLSFYLKPDYYIPFFNSFIVKIFNKFDIFYSRYFYLSGACFFIKKDNFEKIGLFDENFFMYFEEPDISNRFLQNKLKIYYNNNVKYVHLIGNRDSISHSLIQYELKSWIYYLKKYQLNIKLNFFFKKIEFYFRSKEKHKIFIDFIKSMNNLI